MLQALMALGPIFGKQFGVVTAAQASAAGVSKQRLAELVAAGVLERCWRGVYRLALQPDSWEQRWMAALLAAGPDAVVSGRAAAWLHDLQHVGVRSRPDVELTIPRGGRRRRGGPAVVTEVHLTGDDVTERAPWRLTSVAWTIFTLAHRLGVDRTERAVDAAVARRQMTSEGAGRTARRFRCCTGMPVIREVLARHDPAVRLTRSEAERRFLRALRRAGLPLPKANVRVVDADGNVRYLDFAYREWGIMIEIDVYVDHTRTVGRHHDGHRQNALVGAWVPLRFDELDLRYDVDDVVAQVRRALVAAGAPLPSA